MEGGRDAMVVDSGADTGYNEGVHMHPPHVLKINISFVPSLIIYLHSCYSIFFLSFFL